MPNSIKFLLIIFLNSTYILAQDPIIQGLDDPDSHIRIQTIIKIQKEALIQYTNALEERMFLQNEPFLINQYLITLFNLGSQNIDSLAIQLINYADNFSNMDPPLDPLYSKVQATFFLTKLHNYSTVQYAFDLIGRDFPRVSAEALYVVMAVFNELPEYFDRSKNILIDIAYNDPDDFHRTLAIKSLKEKIGTEALELIIERFRNDDNWLVRKACLRHLINLRYYKLDSLMIKRLNSEPEKVMRLTIADTLLIKSGKPSDLKAVIDYEPNESDTIIKKTLGYHIQEFIPPIPDSSVTPYQMAENLTEYTDSLYSYRWIPSDSTYNRYKNEITAIKESVENGDTGTVSMINDELNKVEAEYASEIITREAYLFLHYPLVYIKERLE